MKMTLDLPHSLMRELAARAALEGVTLDDYVANIVQSALLLQPAAGAASKQSPVPEFRRARTKPMPTLSNAELYAMLDAEDAAGIGR